MKHSKDFIDTLIVYCDSFIETCSNNKKENNKKQFETNIKDFIKSIIDLYDIEN